MDQPKDSVSSDFNVNQRGPRGLQGRDTQASFHIKQRFDIVTIGDDAELGEQIFRLDFDSSITTTVEKIAEGYENITFQNMMLEVVATSPLGTSSGGAQFAMVTDPENVTFSGDGNQDVLKYVRQDGSRLIRPRDTWKGDVTPHGTVRTLQTGTPRWWRLGSLVAIVRDVPSTGDKVSFAITLEGDAVFTRACTVQPVTTETAFVVADVTIKDKVMKAVVPHVHQWRPTAIRLADGGLTTLSRKISRSGNAIKCKIEETRAATLTLTCSVSARDQTHKNVIVQVTAPRFRNSGY